MTAPLVSICLPNLNTRAYLEERIDTIFAQTYANWELIVSDNVSDDGSWEFFQEVAARDSRVSIAQAPREGMYPNWNRCIRRARGEYVYIATSDDTMAPDCLEQLVAALEANPHCDIAHCRLLPIDSSGREVEAKTRWWRHGSAFGRSAGPLIDRLHVRLAPLDGLLHLLGGSVYISATQLLVRRSLFERIGLFEPTWASAGDFNWNMRAGLVANTIHVPSTWGGWRLHAAQATANVRMGSLEHGRTVDLMIDDAIERSSPLMAPELRARLAGPWREQAAHLRAYRREVATPQSPARRRASIARHVLSGSSAARAHLGLLLRGRTLPDWVDERVRELRLAPLIMPSPAEPGAHALQDRRAGWRAGRQLSETTRRMNGVLRRIGRAALGSVTRVMVRPHPRRDAPARTVAIVVPLSSRPELLPEEQQSMRHLEHFLGRYDKFLLAPRGAAVRREGFDTLHFPRKFFGSAAAHNRLLIWPRFYERFTDYQYILMYHLDSLVFSDELAEWCREGWDYIGAPWLPCADTPWVKQARVGNGGFTLMKIDSVLEVLYNRYRQKPASYWSDLVTRNGAALGPVFRLLATGERLVPEGSLLCRPLVHWRQSETPSRHGLNNDYFWSFEAVKYLSTFRVATVEAGLRFAFEAAPALCYALNQQRLPFGCHAWNKFDATFWTPHLLGSAPQGRPPAQVPARPTLY